MTVFVIGNTGALIYEPEVRSGPEVAVELSRDIRGGGDLPRWEYGGGARLTVRHRPAEGDAFPPVKFYFSLRFQNEQGQWRQHDYYVSNEALFLRAAGKGEAHGWRNLENKRIRRLGQDPWREVGDLSETPSS